MIDVVGISRHIVRLSARHGVEPLPVVGLLALHALVDVNFAELRVWQRVADNIHRAAPA